MVHQFLPVAVMKQLACSLTFAVTAVATVLTACGIETSPHM